MVTSQFNILICNIEPKYFGSFLLVIIDIYVVYVIINV